MSHRDSNLLRQAAFPSLSPPRRCWVTGWQRQTGLLFCRHTNKIARAHTGCHVWLPAISGSKWGGGPHTRAAPRIMSRVPKPQPLEPDCRLLASGLQVKRRVERKRERKKKRNKKLHPFGLLSTFHLSKKWKEAEGGKKVHLTELSHRLWLLSRDMSAILKPWQIKIRPASTGFGSAILFITGCDRPIHILLLFIYFPLTHIPARQSARREEF